MVTLWWRRSPNTCCSKKILLLLVWQMMHRLSWSVIAIYSTKFVRPKNLTIISSIVASLLAPLLGWLADVRFGRYEIIKFGSLTSFFVSILFYLAVFIERLRNVFSIASVVIARFGSACFSAAMLPFLTDQLIRIKSTYGRGLPNPDWIRITSRLHSIRKRVNPDSTRVQRIV